MDLIEVDQEPIPATKMKWMFEAHSGVSQRCLLNIHFWPMNHMKWKMWQSGCSIQHWCMLASNLLVSLPFLQFYNYISAKFVAINIKGYNKRMKLGICTNFSCAGRSRHVWRCTDPNNQVYGK